MGPGLVGTHVNVVGGTDAQDGFAGTAALAGAPLNCGPIGNNVWSFVVWMKTPKNGGDVKAICTWDSHAAVALLPSHASQGQS